MLLLLLLLHLLLLTCRECATPTATLPAHSQSKWQMPCDPTQPESNQIKTEREMLLNYITSMLYYINSSSSNNSSSSSNCSSS